MKKSPLDIMNIFGKAASDKAKSPSKGKAPAPSDMDEDEIVESAKKSIKPNPFKKAKK